MGKEEVEFELEKPPEVGLIADELRGWSVASLLIHVTWQRTLTTTATCI